MKKLIKKMFVIGPLGLFSLFLIIGGIQYNDISAFMIGIFVIAICGYLTKKLKKSFTT